jgi:hypothetical protein
MEALTIIPDIEQAGGLPLLRRLADRHGHNPVAYRTQIDRITDGIEIGGLRRGTDAGRASVALCAPLLDGRVVLIETSLALLRGAVAAIEARCAA